jgi:hypothetical protein
MVKATVRWNIDAPADKVWTHIGGFFDVADISETVAKSSRENGNNRRVTLAAGSPAGEPGKLTTGSEQFVERLVMRDDQQRIFVYELLEAVNMSLPYDTYRGTARVYEDVPGKSCVFELTGKYTPDSFTEQDARKDIEDFYGFCVKGVKKKLGL